MCRSYSKLAVACITCLQESVDASTGYTIDIKLNIFSLASHPLLANASFVSAATAAHKVAIEVDGPFHYRYFSCSLSLSASASNFLLPIPLPLLGFLLLLFPVSSWPCTICSCT
jgi:hypothetical protein